MARHNELGALGERLAREHLVRLGYTVLDNNTRVGHNELDIVAVRGSRMVFVEVKTRSSDIDEALEAVDKKKIRRIVRAADSFMQRFDAPYDYQFDIIVVIVAPDGTPTLTHFEDAFFPPLSNF